MRNCLAGSRPAGLPAGQGTDFQGAMWRALAVGLARGRNPISISVPCHRVIGAVGALIGTRKLTELVQIDRRIDSKTMRNKPHPANRPHG